LLYREPSIITTSTNRNVLQPSKINRQKRKARIQEIQAASDNPKGKNKSTAVEEGRRPLMKGSQGGSSSSSSTRSVNSQLVDLVVEDVEAGEIERVRARKEGGARWNEADAKHFV
jgi:hypothetical protein